MGRNGRKNRRKNLQAAYLQTPFSDNESEASLQLERLETEPRRSRSPTRTSNHSRRSRSPMRPSTSSRRSHSPTRAHKAQKTRSPTQEPQEIAVGEEFADGALDMDSSEDTDSESEKPPLQDRLPTNSHAIRMTQEAVAASPNVIQEFVRHRKHKALRKFFNRLNARIRKENSKVDLNDINLGTIPYANYEGILQGYTGTFENFVGNTNHEEAWNRFNETYKLIAALNMRHWIRSDWNLDESWAEERISLPNPHPIKDHSPLISEEEKAKDVDKLLPSIETDADHISVEELDALESRTWDEQRKMSSGTVLYWWPKGSGSQTFVIYGSVAAPIFRIRAGSYESYNPRKVERVLISKTRGTAKEVEEDDDGVLDEHWKYNRRDVAGILGIGWKIEDDDEDGINPLSLLQPIKGALYPQTRALVKWRDGTRTVEGRSFIRRITMGSSLDGDKTIYQKAIEMEKAYRENQGLEHYEDDSASEEEPRASEKPRQYNAGVLRSHVRFRDISPAESSDEGDYAREPYSRRHSTREGSARSRRQSTRESSNERDSAHSRRHSTREGSARSRRQSTRESSNERDSAHSRRHSTREGSARSRRQSTREV